MKIRISEVLTEDQYVWIARFVYREYVHQVENKMRAFDTSLVAQQMTAHSEAPPCLVKCVEAHAELLADLCTVEDETPAPVFVPLVLGKFHELSEPYYECGDGWEVVNNTQMRSWFVFRDSRVNEPNENNVECFHKYKHYFDSPAAALSAINAYLESEWNKTHKA